VNKPLFEGEASASRLAEALQTIKHRTTRCRADRAAPANSVGIGEAAGAKNISIKKLREMVFGRRTEKRRKAGGAIGEKSGETGRAEEEERREERGEAGKVE
jgi:hypothetical protein